MLIWRWREFYLLLILLLSYFKLLMNIIVYHWPLLNISNCYFFELYSRWNKPLRIPWNGKWKLPTVQFCKLLRYCWTRARCRCPLWAPDAVVNMLRQSSSSRVGAAVTRLHWPGVTETFCKFSKKQTRQVDEQLIRYSNLDLLVKHFCMLYVRQKFLIRIR